MTLFLYYLLFPCLRGQGLTSSDLFNLSLPYFLRYDLSLVWNSPVRLHRLKSETQGSTHLSLHHNCWIMGTPAYSAFLCRLYGSNTGPHIYIAGTLPAESSFQMSIILIDQTIK